MSRVNYKINTSENESSNKFSSRIGVGRVREKVGVKGDYAIVNFDSSFISNNREGDGSSANPYTYMLDIEDKLVNSITANKSKVTTLLSDSKSLKEKLSVIGKKQLVNYASSNSLMFTCELPQENISNNFNQKNLKVTSQKGLTIKNVFNTSSVGLKVKPININNLMFNNGFMVEVVDGINFLDSKIIVDLQYDMGDTYTSAVPLDKYDVKIKNITRKSFVFYITEDKIPLTHHKLLSKYHRMSVTCVIE
tara:strand:- start:4942 stop:5691 length:750 start_codon:yes stop_codon:yes gene_type:complete